MTSSSLHAHRVVEVLIGIALLVFCAYEIRQGHTIGSWRTYDRDESPFAFWSSIVLQLVIAGAFLFGYTAWR